MWWGWWMASIPLLISPVFLASTQWNRPQEGPGCSVPWPALTRARTYSFLLKGIGRKFIRPKRYLQGPSQLRGIGRARQEGLSWTDFTLREAGRPRRKSLPEGGESCKEERVEMPGPKCQEWPRSASPELVCKDHVKVRLGLSHSRNKVVLG